jgi:glycosyltransferase involved in cell wall biosynthesis
MTSVVGDRSGSVSVVVACFNEEECIGACLDAIFKVLPSCEVIVVHGGTDRTAEIARAYQTQIGCVHVIDNHPDFGKGHAIRVGGNAARREFVAQFDADLQFDAADLPALFEPLWEGRLDVTLGSRYMKDSVRQRDSVPGFFRWFGNNFASLYASMWSRVRLTDVQAGVKAWTKRAWRVFDIKSDNYSYEAEIGVKAALRGLRVADVPVRTYARQGGATNVNVVWDGLRLLKDITLFGLRFK